MGLRGGMWFFAVLRHWSGDTARRFAQGILAINTWDTFTR